MTLTEIRKKAEEGCASSQYLLGNIYTKVLYSESYGVALDKAEGVEWYRKAAEQGNAEAQNAMGYAYDTGNGVAQDYAEAVKWYKKAAVQGNAIARRNLGHCYYKGLGVRKSLYEALHWYGLEEADEEGYTAALMCRQIEREIAELEEK